MIYIVFKEKVYQIIRGEQMTNRVLYVADVKSDIKASQFPL